MGEIIIPAVLRVHGIPISADRTDTSPPDMLLTRTEAHMLADKLNEGCVHEGMRYVAHMEPEGDWDAKGWDVSLKPQPHPERLED
jgi:hypothetical protein